MEKILVVDDDVSLLSIVRLLLESNGYLVADAGGSQHALQQLQTEVFDLALVDWRLNDEDGVEVMEAIHAVNPELPVIILTAFGTIEKAVQAMNRGAYGFLTKPIGREELLLQIKRALERNRLVKKVQQLKQIVERKYSFENIIAKSDKMQAVLHQVALAAETDATVHLEGESGTGKELIAKSLHAASCRKDAPFVAVNCAAIPETLLESELFGYERGAFTGAVNTRNGLMKAADGGTFLLDEISEMPLAVQAKLLRVLEEKTFYQLGSSKLVEFNARFITASNKALDAVVEAGQFRKDLYFRIRVIPIVIPPLRERKEDIYPLAKHFLNHHAARMNKPIRDFSQAALQKLFSYDWPGNVRELENTVEYAVTMTNRDVISDELVLWGRSPPRKHLKPLKEAREAFERNYLVELLELTRGNITQAAKMAGRNRADLYSILRKYELNPEDFRRNSNAH